MRSGRKLSALGIVAVVLVLVGPPLAYIRVVRPIVGFALFGLGGILAVLVGVGAIIGLARGRGLAPGGALALLVAIVFVGMIASGRNHPRINDFTTNVQDPPALQFASSLPENRGRDMTYPAGFAAVQQQCCSDLQTLEVPLPAGETLERARRLAEAQPSWRVTSTDPATGTVAAVATSRLFHFQDDIVIRVRGKGDGASAVDMRSKSRDGQGDFGVNATRIRDFMAALRTAARSG